MSKTKQQLRNIPPTPQQLFEASILLLQTKGVLEVLIEAKDKGREDSPEASTVQALYAAVDQLDRARAIIEAPAMGVQS
ncbi:MAG: hypothetical protein QM696_08630 [Steroidobacteraceae bacterium]